MARYKTVFCMHGILMGQGLGDSCQNHQTENFETPFSQSGPQVLVGTACQETPPTLPTYCYEELVRCQGDLITEWPSLTTRRDPEDYSPRPPNTKPKPPNTTLRLHNTTPKLPTPTPFLPWQPEAAQCNPEAAHHNPEVAADNLGADQCQMQARLPTTTLRLSSTTQGPCFLGMTNPGDAKIDGAATLHNLVSLTNDDQRITISQNLNGF